jgi:hypothetical protein
MKFEWNGDRCIICLKSEVLTKEHIIPAALSGKLSANFLCVGCNSKLGSAIDHSACSDPEIRQAALDMPDMPEDRRIKINQKLNQRQKFIIRTPGREVEAVANGDLIRPVTFVNEAGYLMKPSEDTIADIKAFMLKQGKDAKSIEEAIAKYNSAPDNQTIEVTPGFVVRKFSMEDMTIQPTGKPIQSLLLLKIAYEFLALCVGKAIYGEEPELVRVRTALLTLDEKNAFVEVFPRENKYRVHGIAFEGNNPFAQIQVRLFGSMAFRVNFPKLTLGGVRIAYTHDLGTGDDWAVDRDVPHSKPEPSANSLPGFA